jgi:hypothetical protein
VSARLAAAGACLLFGRAAVDAGGQALEVASWLTGTFESDSPAAAGATRETVRIVIVAVPKSRIADGVPVVYLEQAAAPKLDEPSQQRFFRLEEDGEAVRMRAFDPKDPLIVRGKWRDPSVLALYGASDMRERPGCAILLRKSADRWEGGTQGTGCPSTRRTAATMASTLIVSRDGFIQWDRGFDEKGRQAWGSTEGGTRFVKRSATAPVDDRLMERPVGRRGEEKAKEGFSANGKEGTGAGAASKGAALAPAPATDDAIYLLGPYSPSKKIKFSELRDGDSTRVPLRRVFALLGVETEGMGARRVLAPAVLLVTGRDGYAAVFSAEEVLAADGPELDLAGTPGIVDAFSEERSVLDVVSIELKLLATNPKQP